MRSVKGEGEVDRSVGLGVISVNCEKVRSTEGVPAKESNGVCDHCVALRTVEQREENV